MRQFFEWVVSHWGFCGFVLLAFVQITPGIKWNPLTWLGNLFFGSLRKALADLQSTVDDNEKDRIRWEILQFATSCRNGIRHTQDDFEHVIAQNDKYRRLLLKTNDANGVFNEEYNYILRIYRERQEKNDFL